jgi:hypothetical protein
MDHIMQMCDALKHLPLGAHILRCIGRAYRYSGQTYLAQHASSSSSTSSKKQQQQRKLLPLIQDQWRNWKHVSTAALAQARVMLQPNAKTTIPSSSSSSSRRCYDAGPVNVSQIQYDPVDPSKPMDMDFEDRDIDSVWEDMNNLSYEQSGIRNESEMAEEEDQAQMGKAQTAISTSLQVEAIWKVWKMDLDRTIRQACDLIFQEQYFFFTPSRQPPPPSPMMVSNHHDNQHPQDGWVSTTSGRAITIEYAKLRAAQLLIRIGDIMVKRSKQDTAWMK